MNSLGQGIPTMREHDRWLARIDGITRMGAARVIEQHPLPAVAPFLKDGGIQAAAGRNGKKKKQPNDIVAARRHRGCLAKFDG
jgi:hypothetical protein